MIGLDSVTSSLIVGEEVIAVLDQMDGPIGASPESGLKAPGAGAHGYRPVNLFCSEPTQTHVELAF